MSKTELRNVTGVYNPMTLDELREIFSMVRVAKSMVNISILLYLYRIG